jgi:hypothetical protein
METSHELLHLDKWSLVQWKIMGIPTSCIWIMIWFDKAFNSSYSMKFWGYVTWNAELLCIEFCSFVQSHILLNYLTC